MLPCSPLSRFSFTAVLSLAALLSAPAAFASKDSVPDWVHTAIAQPAGTYAKETSAVVLLDETVYTVANDGKAVEHDRHVLRILRPSGREEAIIHIPYNKDSKILSLHVWSVGPDGHEYALKDNEIADLGYPGSGGSYDDVRYRIARAPGADPGGVVAYELEQRATPYLRQTTWFFQGSLPHVTQSFTLELPPGFTWNTTWAHHEQARPIELEHQRFRWEMNQTSAIDLENVPLSPSYEALAGRMTVDYAPPGDTELPLGSWQGVGAWYDRLSRDRLVATPEIAAKAAELTTGKQDSSSESAAINPIPPPTSSATATATAKTRPRCSPPCSRA
jgi:Domain of Unknown Function with PDB structure (DUF3857)